MNVFIATYAGCFIGSVPVLLPSHSDTTVTAGFEDFTKEVEHFLLT